MAVVTANKFAMEAMTQRHSENVGEVVETIRLQPQERVAERIVVKGII